LALPVEIALDTCAEVDLISIDLVKQLRLKPCENKNLPILQAVNQQELPHYGAYNVRLELVDSHGARRVTYRPYLAIDRDPKDTQILLGMPGLSDMKIAIDCELRKWYYKITKADIKLDKHSKFSKHARGVKAYALVEINQLIHDKRSTIDKALEGIPMELINHQEVFSEEKAKKLAPHKDIDLGIEL
jgi:hypothetical protein